MDVATVLLDAVIDTLIAAGSRTDVYPEVQEHIRGVYRRAGTLPVTPEDV